MQIIRTLRPDDADQAEVIMRGDWNFVLIFEGNERAVFDEILDTMRAMDISTDNIIFANGADDWLKNPAATTEGLPYIGYSSDNYMIWEMYTRDKNFAANEMKIFHALTKKFYGLDDGTGYFLDLGANIGTTCIYFLKKLAPNLKVLAFEPDLETFKLLRANLILNDLDGRTTAVNCGLGDKCDEMTMYLDTDNPGGNSLLEKMIDLLKATGYTRFISIVELMTTYKEKIYPIENLAVAAEYAKPPLGQAGDIFLIKNFA